MLLRDKHKPVWRTVWFALASCLTLLLLSLVPAISEALQTLDVRAAFWFNGLAGNSPVFDRFVLLVADEDGRERIVVLVFVWLLTWFWLERSRVERARLLGTTLFVASVLGLFFLLDAMLDDIFERRSPSYMMHELHHFHDISKILDFQVDLTDKRSFPSASAMILFTVGFLLLRLRRRKGGMLALALGLTVPLMQCIAGQSWVSDIYLGALPMSLLISALAVETPFIGVLEWFVQLAAAAVDQAEKFSRNLGPMWRHRRLYWASQNVFHMEVAVKRYAAKELHHVLDPHKQHTHETVRLEVPLGGLRSVVRVASLGPLRAVVRAYPINRRHEAEQHSRAAGLLARHGVRVPKIYHQVDSPRKYGALFLIEEFIDGGSREPKDLTLDDVKAAASELARLHRITSEVWGPIDAPRTEEYGSVLLRRLERQLVLAEKGPILKGQQANIAKVRAWLNTWREDLNGLRRFSLVHGKLHRENCIFEISGGFCLLDITTLEWGVPSSDLVLVHHSQCGCSPELIRQFDEFYYEALPPSLVAQAQHFAPLYNAVFCLGQVAKYTKRLGRSQKRQVGDAITKGTHWWHRLLGVVEGDRQQEKPITDTSAE